MQGSPVRKIWNGERRSHETIALGRHGVGRETIDACDFSRGSRHYCPILLPLKLTATESNEPLNPLLSLTPPRSAVLCALCASVVLFPYTTGYCLILPPLRLTATNSTKPLNPLLSLPPPPRSVVLCALCASVVLFPYTTGYCLMLPHSD